VLGIYKYIERTSILAMSLIFGCMLIVQLFWPFNVDQGMFSFVGSVIADGGVLYKDAWEVKGPVVHFIYAFSEVIFGNKFISIRIFDLCLVTISAFYLYKILSDNLAKRIAAFLACCYGISFYPDNWASAQPDGWAAMILPIILYLSMKISDDFSIIKAVSIGILLCFISLIKPFYILFILVILPYLLSKKEGKLGADSLKNLSLVAMGAIFGFAILFIYLLLNDGLNDFIDIFILFNLNTHKYVSVGGVEEIKNSLFSFFISYERGVLTILSIFGLIYKLKDYKKSTTICIIWVIFSALCVVIQGKYIYYQFFIFIPLIFIMVGHFLQEIGVNFGKKYVPMIMVVILGFIVSNQDRIWNVNQSVKYIVGASSQQLYYNKFPIVGKDKDVFSSSVNDIILVSDYLKKSSAEGDMIQVWGLESVIYFLSGVKPATKFGHLYPFVVGSEKSRENYKQEFLGKIITVRPKYIIVTNNDANMLIGKTSKKHLMEFVALNDFVTNNYKIVKKIGDYEIYKKN